MSLHIVRQWIEICKVLCVTCLCIKATVRHYVVNSVRFSGYFYETPYLKLKKKKFMFLPISDKV